MVAKGGDEIQLGTVYQVYFFPTRFFSFSSRLSVLSVRARLYYSRSHYVTFPLLYNPPTNSILPLYPHRLTYHHVSTGSSPTILQPRR